MKAYMNSCPPELLLHVHVHFHQSSVWMHSSSKAHLYYCCETMNCVEQQISILCIWAVGCWSGMVERMIARHNIELLEKKQRQRGVSNKWSRTGLTYYFVWHLYLTVLFISLFFNDTKSKDTCLLGCYNLST